MLAQTIEFRLESQTITVTRGAAATPAGARAVSLPEARELVHRISDLHVLARLLELAEPTRSVVVVEDRLALVRALDDALGRGLLRVSARVTGRNSNQASAWVSAAREVVEADAEDERGWIEIQLQDEDGNPVPRVRYEVVLPTGELRRGYLDKAGFARLDAIPDGQCQVSFPDYDFSSWDTA